MPLDLTPIDDAALSPAVRKTVGPGAPPQLLMMAARGMAPLPPADLVTALYQLGFADDQEIAEAARKSAKELPDSVLSSALAAALDARVLDFFGRALLQRSKMVALVLANARTADETFASLAAKASGEILEQIAQNEQRLLRHPPIITALYLNPRTRMSTATRALELAVRNGVQVDGIPSYEEVKAAIESEGAADAAADAAFAAALAAGGSAAAAVVPVAVLEGPLDEQTAEQLAEAAHLLAESAAADEGTSDTAQSIGRLPMAAKLRLASIGNAFARALLVRDGNKVVAMAAVRSPAMTEQEAERYASNRSLHEEVVRYLATQRQFTKRYSVKLNLVNNPKCPLQLGMSFLAHLTPKDLRNVSRSKSVQSALAKAAQGLVLKREQK